MFDNHYFKTIISNYSVDNNDLWDSAFTPNLVLRYRFNEAVSNKAAHSILKRAWRKIAARALAAYLAGADTESDFAVLGYRLAPDEWEIVSEVPEDLVSEVVAVADDASQDEKVADFAAFQVIGTGLAGFTGYCSAAIFDASASRSLFSYPSGTQKSRAA